jgi:2-oxoglutarate dehydrogenase E2 component (dihydrolipoamide succinyltransferase)
VPEPEPRLLLGDIGESLAREFGIDLPTEPDPVELAPYVPEAPAPEPEPAPAPPAGPAPSPYGGPMPGMSASPPSPGTFAGFALPPSPFLLLRQDPAAPDPGQAQS